jgi:5-methyltetrahydropteroyltriglutamate--homocysteine methyltransferase
MTTTRPLFHADHVGSLWRPQEIREARVKNAAGNLSANALKEIEDRQITRIIGRQEEIGLQVVTDGEFRRHAWQWDFLQGLDGVTAAKREAASLNGADMRQPVIKVIAPIGFTSHPMLSHFAFVKGKTKVTPKMCIPSPTHLVSVMRDWRDVVDRSIYPDLESLFVDLSSAYRKAIKAFADAGCRYLEVDDCNMSFLCDPNVRDAVTKRGDDPDLLLRAFVDLVNSALTDRPKGMAIAMHSCRGNARGGFASGGYEAVADIIFGGLNVDAFLLEYDDERSGDFEPLRFVPETKAVALGLVSTKRNAMEPKDVLKRRIDAAARYVYIDRLSLCPQCGFASTEENAPLNEEEQWTKLARIVDVAREVWSH